MLYIFIDKIYIKPFDNKVVEVTITKNSNGYNVKPIKKPIELNDKQLKQLISITIEEAYKYQQKNK